MQSKSTEKKLRILTSDLSIADAITEINGNSQLEKLIADNSLKRGGKAALTDEKSLNFESAVKDREVAVLPGGSSANVLVTLKKLLGKKNVDVDFLSVVGDDYYGKIIRDSFDEVGINLLPDKTIYQGQNPQVAVSYVMTYPNGERTIATNPGNAKAILKKDIVTDDMVKKSDVIFVQGSLWEKLDHDFADKLLELRWNHRKDKKQLWLALPTHAKFGEEKADMFNWLIPSANLILGNGEELSRIYKTSDTNVALQKLKQTFEEHPVLRNEGFDKEQVAFITLGERGAAIVTKDKIKYVSPRDIKPEEVVNTLGAGDTAFAGFIAGYIKELPHEASAEIAMALANQKLRHNGPRLDNPLSSLHKASPYLADLVLDASRSPVGVGVKR